ncbi:hypothetical protein BH10PAT2_BH10PAT2_2980 [soil metagenome]
MIIFSFIAVPQIQAATLFSSGFESGDFTGWSSSTTDGGDLSVTSGAKIHGTYGMRALINDTHAMYVNDGSPTAATSYRARFYLNPNSLSMADSTSVTVFQPYNASFGSAYFVGLQYLGGAYKIFYSVDQDSGTLYSSSYTITNAPHNIELNWKASTGPGAPEYGVEFQNSSHGVVSLDISALNPYTVYYFKVRGGNGCQPGDWSNEMAAKTGVISTQYKFSSLPLIWKTPVSSRLIPSSVKNVAITTAKTEEVIISPTINTPLSTVQTIPQAPPTALTQPVVATTPTPTSTQSFFDRIGSFISGLFGR